MIDYTEKNDDFIAHDLSFWQVLSQYYVNFFPYLANLVSPVFVFISTIIVTAQLAAHTEVIAILSAGISFKRFLFSYFIGAVLLAGLIFCMQAWLLPIANKNRIAFEAKHLGGKTSEYRHRHFILGGGGYAYAYAYDDYEKKAQVVTLELIKDNRLVTKIYAPHAQWKESTQSWKISSYMKRTYHDEGDEISYGRNLDTVLNLRPEDFFPSLKKREVLTISGLNDVIKDIEERKIERIEPYLVEKYNRYAYPVAIIILTIMAVIVSAKKSRGGAGMPIFIGFVLAFTFIAAIYVIRLMSESGDMNPLTGALLPLVSFSLITVMLYRTVPR